MAGMSTTFESKDFRRRGSEWLHSVRRELGARLDRAIRPGTRDWAAACHLLPVIGLAVFMPLLGVLIALAIWRGKRDRETGVEVQGREALNFQINVAVAAIIAQAIGAFAYLLLALVASSLALVAGIRVAQGDHFRYPWILRPLATPR